MDHGIKHLCCRDHLLTGFIYFFYDHFLNDRHFLCRNLHAHVSSCDHDCIRNLDDLINAVHAFCILNFGNDLNLFPTIFLEQFTDLLYIFCSTHKRCCHIIYIFFYTEQQIGFIHFTNIRQTQMNARNVDPFMIRHFAAIIDITDNICICQLFHCHLDQAVIDQNTLSDFDITNQLRIRNSYNMFITLYFSSGQHKLIALLQCDRTIFKVPYTNLRAFSIQQCRNWSAVTLTQQTQFCETFLLLLMRPMRKIKSCNIHAFLNQAL